MNLLWLLSDKGTRVRFCWIPSHCGIEWNERVDQLAKGTLDHDIDPLASVHYTDLKPLVNPYIQHLVQTKWDVAIHGRDSYLLKPTLEPRKKFQHLTRAEKFVTTRLRLAIRRQPSLISCPENRRLLVTIVVKPWPLTICSWSVQCCGTVGHREYCIADALRNFYEAILETCIMEFLREAGFFYLIWTVSHSIWIFIWTNTNRCNLLTSSSLQA